jgi:outer membrane biogenesis lipoprotein LolB
MKNIGLVIIISIMAILMLPACASSFTQPKVATPTVQPTPIVQPTPTSDSVFGQFQTDLTQDQQSSQQLSVSISSVTNQGTASIKVHTLPGAAIAIQLTYCGQQVNKTEHADSAGDYVLNWTPSGNCGEMATAKVTASAGGQSSTSMTSFSV